MTYLMNESLLPLLFVIVQMFIRNRTDMNRPQEGARYSAFT